jgi:Sigma-70, region 4
VAHTEVAELTMSRLDELPPDQRAALSLLLRQRKSYAEVALLLGIAERAVHDRAHAALAVLALREARPLPPEGREEIGDYLLGQAGVAERLRTRTYLAGSAEARAWAEALTGELAPLAGADLPEIPPPSSPASTGSPTPPRSSAPASSPAPPSASRPVPVRDLAASLAAGEDSSSSSAEHSSSPPSSRLGGALLLAAIVVAVVVAVILITSSGGGSHPKTTATTTTTAASKTGPSVVQLALHSPDATSRTVGVVAVLSEKGKHAFYIEAQHLPATRGFFYAVWLYNSHTSAEALSRAPGVSSTHKLAGGAPLPANAGSFREILLTRETSSKPTHPGHTVLRGAFKLEN